MNRLLRIFGWVWIVLALTACAQVDRADRSVPAGSLVFVGVDVVTMAEPDEILADQIVIIVDDIIADIYPNDGKVPGSGVEVVDAKGMYMIPGLGDMHAHFGPGGATELRVFVAYGVTLLRVMWGGEEILSLRDQVDEKALLGPRIITAGSIIDGVAHEGLLSTGPQLKEVTTVEQARRLVAEEKAAGYDFIKIYSDLSPVVFDAISQAAKESGMPFAGHVPRDVPIEYAIRSGMATMEHGIGFAKTTVRDDIDLGQGQTSAERIRLGRAIADGETSLNEIFDQTKMREIANMAAESGVWSVPTLVVFQQMVLTHDEMKSQLAREEMQYSAPEIRQYWSRVSDNRGPLVSEEDVAMAMELFPALLERVRILNEAGAGILAGTDTVNPFVFPGISLHEELELLVRAGMTPYQSLQTATSNVAKFLGETGKIGSVVAGSRADLVLLSANPLDDIRNTRTIVGVVRNGEWFDSVERQEMLADVAAQFASQPEADTP
jgi:imidazolonepropionase-like amidohydrolase